MESNQTTNEELSQPVAGNTEEVIKAINEESVEHIPQNTGEELEKPIKPGVFQKGEDPRRNLEGRPLGAKNFTTKVKEALEELGQIKLNGKDVSYQEALVKKILHKAVVEGDKDMIKLIWNYLDGMPSQTLNHQGGVLVTTLSVEERNKLEDILYGPKERTTEEPVDSTATNEGVEQGSAGDSNKWHSGAEEIPLQS